MAQKRDLGLGWACGRPGGAEFFKKQLFRLDETIKSQTCQSLGTGSAILLEAAKHAEASKGASVFEAFGMHGQR